MNKRSDSSKKGSNEKGTGNDNRPVVFGVALFLVFVPLFSRVVTDFFLNIDDDVFITNNPHLRSFSWENLKDIFTSTYGGNYHPVTTLLEAVEFALFGLKPAAFHSVSVLMHLLNTFLVYRLAGRFSNNFGFRALVTSVFAFHPMHIETVAWITDQTDLFCTAFMSGSLICYVDWIKEGKRSRLSLSLILFLSALGSKPAAIALAFLIPVLDWHFGKRWTSNISIKALYLIPAIVFAYITFVALGASTKINAELLPEYDLIQRLIAANFAFCYYIVAFVFPFDLSALHLVPRDIPTYYYLAIPFNLSLLYAMWRIRHRMPHVLTGLLFYALPIALVLQLIPSGYNAVAERYTYFPYIGLSLMIAFLFDYSAKGVCRLPGFLEGRTVGVTWAFAFYLVCTTAVSLGTWKDLLSMNRNIADHNRHSGFAQLTALFQEMDAGDVQGATSRLEDIEPMDTSSAQMQFMKGKAYYRLGKFDKALSFFQRSQRLQPVQPEIDESLALMYFENNSMDSAEVYFTKLITRDTVPNATNLSNRATSRYYLKDYAGAIADYTAALKADPTLGNVLAQRGVCWAEMGEVEKGCLDLKGAVSAGYTQFQPEVDKYCGGK